MEKALKNIGKSFLFLLLMAVALRPVVVEASVVALPKTGPVVLSFVIGHSPIQANAASLTKNLQNQSNLRVIAKETLNVCLFSPQVSKSKYCPDPSRQLAAHSVFRSLSLQKSLILRI